MDWTNLLPALWVLWVLGVGLMAGSFLNVVVARLPYQKSVVWPGSRCFACLHPIRLTDNLPVVGYLRLGGRCRQCGARFSSRYMWVELGVGLAFVGLFYVDVLSQARGGPDWFAPWHHAPGREFSFLRMEGLPPPACWAVFAFHACLLFLLTAAALIDAEHRIIPPLLTYGGTLIGLAGSALMPWPWPSAPSDIPVKPGAAWYFPGRPLPVGAAVWPPTGPPPGWAPAGSWQLGLLTGAAGAAAGMAVGRAVKGAFEAGFGKEAMGLGDADLLMMGGAFLGWQPAVLALFVGAVVAVPVVIPLKLWQWARGRGVQSELPFGPAIAAGVAVTWLAWPWLDTYVRVMFDPMVVGLVVVLAGGFMLVAGLLVGLRRPG